MTALYAFCREVDDIVDECHEPMVAERKLQWWREEIGALFTGKPSHPVCLALQEALVHYPLEQLSLIHISEPTRLQV